MNFVIGKRNNGHDLGAGGATSRRRAGWLDVAESAKWARCWPSVASGRIMGKQVS